VIPMLDNIKKAYPLLFVLYPIIFLYANHMGQISPFSLMSAVMLAVTFSFLAYGFWLFLLRNSQKASLALVATAILFFSYGHVYSFLAGEKIFGCEIGRHRYLVFVWCALLVAQFIILKRLRIDLERIISFVRTTGFFLVLMVIVTIAVNSFSLMRVTQIKIVPDEITTSAEKIPAFKRKTPDIYYLILDGYPCNSTLKEVFGFDNSAFLDKLREKGFFIAEKSRSNYAETFISLASSLNMQYLNDVQNVDISMEHGYKKFSAMIEDSRVQGFLKAKGYSFINIGAGYAMTNTNRNADVNLSYMGLNELERGLITTTALKLFETVFIGNTLRQQFLHTLKSLQDSAYIPGSKFVFVHVIAPHPPFVFDREGLPVHHLNVREHGRLAWHPKSQFLGQLEFTNKMILDAVDALLAHSQELPLIIIQADHGSAFTFRDGWENPSDIMLKERMGILNGYYLPQGGRDELYDTITPVNTFRLVFRRYFKADIEPLEDISYYSTYEHPMRFIELPRL